MVNLSDLPEPERRAFVEAQIHASGLSAGTYDEAAHAGFLEAPASMRAEAERKAAIVRALLSMPNDLRWEDKATVLRKKFGPKGISKPSLRRLQRAVTSVDPINFAPVLLAGYKGGARRADVSNDAWAFFVSTLRLAGPDFPLTQAWRDVRDVSRKRRWSWPSYPTIYRRWNQLPEAEKLVVRHGREVAIGRLAQPIMRDKTSIRSLEWVSLDGRKLDFWVDCGDGRALRLTLLALIDVASNKVLGFEICRSENATGTVRLIRQVCETYGIFDRLYTDNGAAFAGHLVAGGNVHRFRNAGAKLAAVKPLGICHHLDIRLHFALPKNAQAKIAEWTFATLSRVIDDRPEFAGAHAGHAPGTSPSPNVKPVPFEVAEAVIRREIERHNHETGRRSQGAHGRSYDEVFQAGLVGRFKRKATRYQLRLASMIYTPVAVDRWGRVTVDTWTYGGPETQADLLPFFGKGRVLLGRNPDDFSEAAMAFDEDGRLICDGIEPVNKGAYDSKDGVREAARNGKAARDAVAQAEAANDYLNDAEFAAALADLDAYKPEESAPEDVVAARFGSPLQPARKAGQAKPKLVREAIPAEYLKNFDAAIAKGGKLA